MAKRIYINTNNYLVIADDTDTSIDTRNSANNVYVEINGTLFVFYRKSDNQLLESVYYADVRNEAGGTYANITVFTDLVESKTGTVDVVSLSSGLEIASGNVPGSSIAQIGSRNPNVGGLFEDVWDAGALITLNYDAQTGNFTPGLVLTGGTSSATATIVTDKDDGTTGTLTIRNITGTFQTNETITDSGSGSATSDGVVASILARVEPTAGQTWEVICESANDTSAGTGAQTILVAYLDDAFVAQTEIVSLNGQTAVTLVATDAYRMRSISVASWGSATNVVYGKTNLGTIIVRDSVTENIMGAITFEDSLAGDEHGFNNTQDSHYTIPAGKTGFPVLITTNVTKNEDVVIRALARLDGVDGYSTVGEMSNYQNSFIEDLSMAPAGLPEKTDVKFIAKSDNDGVIVNIGLVVILIDN